MYDAVDWAVIFLLAGLIPLGVAFDETGDADLLGSLVALSASSLSTIGDLWAFYVVTALATALVSNTASVVLMIPVGGEAAPQVGANPSAFVLAVTLVASADFMTPIGYQTSLLVFDREVRLRNPILELGVIRSTRPRCRLRPARARLRTALGRRVYALCGRRNRARRPAVRVHRTDRNPDCPTRVNRARGANATAYR